MKFNIQKDCFQINTGSIKVVKIYLVIDFLYDNICVELKLMSPVYIKH